MDPKAEPLLRQTVTGEWTDLSVSPVHTVAENGETTATVAEFGDSRTFLRQCGQALKPDTHYPFKRVVCTGPFGEKHCLQCFFVERAVKPDTHYPFERPVRTGSVYRA